MWSGGHRDWSKVGVSRIGELAWNGGVTVTGTTIHTSIRRTADDTGGSGDQEQGLCLMHPYRSPYRYRSRNGVERNACMRASSV